MTSLPVVRVEGTSHNYGSLSTATEHDTSDQANATTMSSGGLRPPRRGGRRRAPRTRLTSTGESLLNELERFSRRTLSTSHSNEIQNEVLQVMADTASHADGDSDADAEAATAGAGDGEGSPLLQRRESDERDGEHSISNFETMIHILKGNIGMGVLTLPIAIRNSGLMFGSIGLTVIAYICVHCMKMLVRAAHKALSSRPHMAFLDYADTAELAFKDGGGQWAKWSKFMRKLINTFLTLSQIGSNAVYVLFIAQNLQPIFQHYGGEIFKKLNYRYYILMVLPPTLAICSIRNLRYLSPFSILANIICLLGLGFIFYYIFHEPLPNSHSVDWLADTSRLPLFFGTAIFAIEGISIVLPIENQMKRPSDMLGWNGVLSTSMNLVIILYVAIGFFGYIKYGETIQSSITLNLPPTEILAQITLLFFSLSVFFSYALQFYVLIEILGPNVLRPLVPQTWYLTSEYLLRVALNILTFALAATVPWLDLLVSLLGAVKMSTLALMAPALIDTAINWHDLGKYKWRLVKNAAIFLFGLFGCIMGTYVSMLNIVENFKHDEGL